MVNQITFKYNRRKEKIELFISLEDLDKLLNLDVTWYAYHNWSNNSYYGRTTQYLGTKNGKPKYKMIYIQKYLIEYEYKEKGEKFCLDHINHNTLDNRRDNLRIIKGKLNSIYRKQRNSNNKSGYRNVCWIRDCWKIQLQINGKNYRFPEKFIDVNEAGKFAEEMRQKYYGEFAGGN